MTTLNKHAPLKMKVIQGNHKNLYHEKSEKSNYGMISVGKRANISNKPEIIKLYKQPKYYVVNFSRKVKKEHYQKHMPHGAFSKIFCKFCKPFFSNKTSFEDKIVLVEGGSSI